MATLDVTEVITCPLFTSPVLLVHRLESYDSKGNPVWTDGGVKEVMAVVTSDLKKLERLPEALRREGAIMVRFMIDDKPEDFQGSGQDRVIWRGKKFIVKDCADYSQFGRGFLRLICHPEEVSHGGY